MKFSDPGGGRNDLTLSTGSWPSSTVLGGTATCHGYVSFFPPTLASVTSAATGPSRSTLDTPSRSTPVTTTRTAIPTAFPTTTRLAHRSRVPTVPDSRPLDYASALPSEATGPPSRTQRLGPAGRRRQEDGNALGSR